MFNARPFMEEDDVEERLLLRLPEEDWPEELLRPEDELLLRLPEDELLLRLLPEELLLRLLPDEELLLLLRLCSLVLRGICASRSPSS